MAFLNESRYRIILYLAILAISLSLRDNGHLKVQPWWSSQRPVSSMEEARPVRLLFLALDGSPRLTKSKSVEDLALALHEHIFTQPQEKFANQPWKLVKTIGIFAQNQAEDKSFDSSRFLANFL